MLKTTIQLFVGIIPEKFLPPMHSNVVNAQDGTNKKIPFTPSETRARIVESTYSRYLRSAPYLKLYRFLKRQRGHWFYNRFLREIGSITLIHARIEQNLKRFLINDFAVPEDKIKFLGGERLTEKLENQIKDSDTPQEIIEAYQDVLTEFNALSKERNQTIKAAYLRDEQSQLPIKSGLFSFKNLTKATSPEKWKDLFYQPVHIQKLEELKSNLEQMEHQLIAAHIRLIMDKHKRMASASSTIKHKIQG